MMKGGIRVGSIFGIPFYIDPSLILILGLLTIDFSAAYTRISVDSAWLYGLLTSILLFASILAHELGHSFTARSHGIAIEAITLNFFGGLTSMKRSAQTPTVEFRVAIAGPLVSLALGISCLGAAFLLQAPQTILGIMALQLGQVNLGLGIFNLLPGLPLDGGQVVKAMIWKFTNSYFTGIKVAARCGQILGWVGIVSGVTIYLSSGRFLAGLPLVILGWFILGNAGAYLQITDLQQALMEITAEVAMTRDFRIIDGDMTIRQFADEFLLMQEPDQQPLYFASTNGRDRGLVMPAALRGADRQGWEMRTITEITKPLSSLDAVDLRTQITKVITILESKNLRELTVLSPVGSVAGVVDRGDVIRALAQKLNWRLPDAYIKQIKADGKFPMNLNLLEIIAQIN